MGKPEAKTDVEAGNKPNITMKENPSLRWSFIRKVYTIVLIQILLTAAAVVAVSHFTAVTNFVFHSGTPGIALFVVFLVLPFALLLPIYAYRKHHPLNLMLLALFTITMAFNVGLASSFSNGKIILLAGILTSVVTFGLTIYTFWAANKGYDFGFLSPFLFTSLLVLITFSLIQLFIPMGKLGSTICSFFAAIIFSGFIIYDTNSLVKKYEYDEYIWAAMSLYLDIVNLFLALVGITDSGNGGCSDS